MVQDICQELIGSFMPHSADVNGKSTKNNINHQLPTDGLPAWTQKLAQKFQALETAERSSSQWKKSSGTKPKNIVDHLRSRDREQVGAGKRIAPCVVLSCFEN